MPPVTEEAKRNIRVRNRVSDLEAYIIIQKKRAGKTQAECARALGIEQSAFSKALKNMTFSITQIFKLLDFLGTSKEDAMALIKGD